MISSVDWQERQELVKNLNSSSTEMEQLRNLCQQLTSQLNMVMGQTNAGKLFWHSHPFLSKL
jgi:hypothetical protein